LIYGLRFFVCATSRATLEVVATFNQLQATEINEWCVSESRVSEILASKQF